MLALVDGFLVIEGGPQKGTILCDEGRIKDIILGEAPEELSRNENIDCVDCSNKYIFPGFIDGHTHLQCFTGIDWTADDFESGTAAAVSGGTTTIVDYATQDRGMTLHEAFSTWKERAEGNCAANYGFHMAMSECTDELLAEIDSIFDEGITSFKSYFAYDHLKLSDSETYRLLRKLKERDGILCTHCENGDLINLLRKEAIQRGETAPIYHALTRPAVAEAEAIAKLCYLAKEADAKINIVHLSSALGLSAVQDARRRGQVVHVESCPQYFLLDQSAYLGDAKDSFSGAKYVMSPPLREKADRLALTEALLNGEIDTLATDHCSFNYATQKERGRADFRKIPNGAPGVEHRVALMINAFRGSLSILDFARLMAKNPAKLFGMYPQKGCLQRGSDADICVWNPETKWTIRAKEQVQKVDYSPYEGFELKGRAELVYVAGTLVAKDGKPTGAKPGKYVARGICSL